MAEQRRLKRRHLIYYLKVFEWKTNRLIGHLVDLTTDGVMLFGESPVQTGVVFQLKMVLPEEIRRSREITFEAKSVWCKKDVNPDFYDTGFEFVRIMDKDREIIERLIQDFLLPG